jgi:hypothetical protein
MTVPPAVRIGLDFDNTIISYDEVFVAAAVERGLVPRGFRGNKQAVRDSIRALPDGELDWQRLQGHVYGKGIVGARAFAGLDSFLHRARVAGAHVRIISHKTEFGHFDPDRVNLRSAAMTWMEAQGFFSADGYGLERADVHFATTRAEKLAQISAAECDLFVDDLEEVLSDPAFPVGVTRILLSEWADPAALPYRVCRSWAAIEQAVFG